jgi:hypothetical protein
MTYYYLLNPKHWRNLTMKQSVVVNGVTLTRATVEAALKELNEPEPQPFRAGALIYLVGDSSTHYIVLEQSSADVFKAHYEPLRCVGESLLWCVGKTTGIVFAFNRVQVRHV